MGFIYVVCAWGIHTYIYIYMKSIRVQLITVVQTTKNAKQGKVTEITASNA